MFTSGQVAVVGGLLKSPMLALVSKARHGTSRASALSQNLLTIERLYMQVEYATLTKHCCSTQGNTTEAHYTGTGHCYTESQAD